MTKFTLIFFYIEIEIGNACSNSGLGVEDRRIYDTQITASSEFDSNHGATNARLNRPAQGSTTGGWSARTNDLNQWIQADLGSVQSVSGVVMQGRNAYPQWVTKYRVQFSGDGKSWSNVVDANGQNVRKQKYNLQLIF